MGLIKIAIIIGAGSYAISKLSSKYAFHSHLQIPPNVGSRSREHQHCCKRSKNMPEGEEKSLQGRNSHEEFVTEENRARLPEYADH